MHLSAAAASAKRTTMTACGSAGKQRTHSTRPNLTHSSHASSSSCEMYARASGAAPISSTENICSSTTTRGQSERGVPSGFSLKLAGETVSGSPNSCQSSRASAACTAASLANVTSPSPLCSPLASLYSLTRRTSPARAKRFCTAVQPISRGIPLTYTVSSPALANAELCFSLRFSALRIALRRRASSCSSSPCCPIWKTASHALSTCSSSSPCSDAASMLRLRAFSSRACSAAIAAA
mmetsp:Transcript_24681/g.61213  ORF Transcript_24681/g.61213 Transcript_24681/m.61213 type:complete len:238 (-) Transcript_24681:40-753(-)